MQCELCLDEHLITFCWVRRNVLYLDDGKRAKVYEVIHIARNENKGCINPSGNHLQIRETLCQNSAAISGKQFKHIQQCKNTNWETILNQCQNLLISNTKSKPIIFCLDCLFLFIFETFPLLKIQLLGSLSFLLYLVSLHLHYFFGNFAPPSSAMTFKNELVAHLGTKLY